MAIGEKIRELRESENMTQENLAGILGIARPTLSHYEKGKLQVPHELIKKIAKHFGVTIDFIYSYSG